MIELNRIYNQDCLEGMKLVDDKSIDLICTDLPYGITNYELDIKIPFNKLWEQYNRIIKDNGAIVLFSSGIFTHHLVMSNQKMWRYDLIWDKGNRVSGFLNAKRMPLRSHESIQVFYKKAPTYNPQFTEGKPLHSKGKSYLFIDGKNSNYGYYDTSTPETRKGSTQKYPKSVLKFDRPHPAIHPTEKPVKLLEWILNTFSNEGELVLDSCMGSATTAIAAINTKRNFIGFEKEEKWFNLGNERIEKLINKL